ncbi:unnamed protein product [Dimorphilus gyrociliatus]|uniref:Uncharacterized protein n=1 Tax=Dimorphilus gyrociliatus TaxID=2664684 RepID=A0A7I8W4Y9_9ANNE|nr:unnamed protein product [Dimorphilus gyrociliatus]
MATWEGEDEIEDVHSLDANYDLVIHQIEYILEKIESEEAELSRRLDERIQQIRHDDDDNSVIRITQDLRDAFNLKRRKVDEFKELFDALRNLDPVEFIEERIKLKSKLLNRRKDILLTKVKLLWQNDETEIGEIVQIKNCTGVQEVRLKIKNVVNLREGRQEIYSIVSCCRGLYLLIYTGSVSRIDFYDLKGSFIKEIYSANTFMDDLALSSCMESMYLIHVADNGARFILKGDFPNLEFVSWRGELNANFIECAEKGLLVGSSFKNWVALYKYDTTVLLWRITCQMVKSIKLSSNKKHFVVFQGESLEICDIENGEMIKSINYSPLTDVRLLKDLSESIIITTLPCGYLIAESSKTLLRMINKEGNFVDNIIDLENPVCVMDSHYHFDQIKVYIIDSKSKLIVLSN